MTPPPLLAKLQLMVFDPFKTTNQYIYVVVCLYNMWTPWSWIVSDQAWLSLSKEGSQCWPSDNHIVAKISYIYIFYIYPITIINSPFRNFLASKYPLAINHGNWKSPYRLLFRLGNHRLQMVDVRLPCLITRGHPPYSIRNILDLVQSWAICLYSAGSHVRMITL